MAKISIREKKLADGRKSLYLDIVTDGKRSKEYLKLYLEPKNRAQNKATLALAEDIKAKRLLGIRENKFDLPKTIDLDASYLDFFKKLVEQRIKADTNGNAGNWDSVYKHLIKYKGDNISFKEIDTNFCEGFKHYLIKKARTKSDKPLSQNSQCSYLNKFKASIKEAHRLKLIHENYAEYVKAIKPDEVEKQHLTIEELKALKNTECTIPVLKHAFLFSCLTGIRWSDIEKLTWREIHQDEHGYKIIFKQKKVKRQEYLPIKASALEYLGKRGAAREKVFVGLKYSGWHNAALLNWVVSAGIPKKITFHCARHTHAILLLNAGVDIFTVSELLGHSEIKTTMVYAKIVDQKKREAVNLLPDIEL
jgi:integrase